MITNDEKTRLPQSGDQTGNVYRITPPVVEPSATVARPEPSGFTVWIEPCPSEMAILSTGPVAIALGGGVEGTGLGAGSTSGLAAGVFAPGVGVAAAAVA